MRGPDYFEGGGKRRLFGGKSHSSARLMAKIDVLLGEGREWVIFATHFPGVKETCVRGLLCRKEKSPEDTNQPI